MGLLELSKADDKLFNFATTIFSQNSKYYNRSMKSEEEIKEFDKLIDSFLIRLSPFFRTQSCHKILEFLIKIYQINVYNSKTLLLSFFPFYSYNFFTKLLQNINVQQIKTFSFLAQNAKMGVNTMADQISKEASNFDFSSEILSFVNKVFKNSISASHYFSFCVEIISALVKTNKMNENIIHLIFVFLKDAFDYIQKSDKIQKEVLIKGTSEIIIKVVSKYSLSNDYLNIILKELLTRVLVNANKSDLIEVIIKTVLIVLLNKVLFYYFYL